MPIKFHKKKYENTNEDMEPMSNRTWASNEQIECIPHTSVLDIWSFCWVKEKTLPWPRPAILDIYHKIPTALNNRLIGWLCLST